MTPLYAVLSETLYETIPIMDDGSGPQEPYRIFEVIAAPTASAARYRAWQTDRNAEQDPKEMPRFAVRKLGMTRRPEGIYTDDTAFWGRHSKRVATLKAPDEI